jgi:hypothetical protein
MRLVRIWRFTELRRVDVERLGLQIRPKPDVHRRLEHPHATHNTNVFFAAVDVGLNDFC